MSNPRVIPVIETTKLLEGRHVIRYYTLKGDFLAEHDPLDKDVPVAPTEPRSFEEWWLSLSGEEFYKVIPGLERRIHMADARSTWQSIFGK